MRTHEACCGRQFGRPQKRLAFVGDRGHRCGHDGHDVDVCKSSCGRVAGVILIGVTG